MNVARRIFILSLVFFVIVILEGVISGLKLQKQDLWTLEDRIVVAAVAVPFFAGSLWGGCIGNRLRVEIIVLVSFIGGNLVLLLINSLLPRLPGDPSNLNRLITMAILWFSVGTMAGYKATRAIYHSGFQAYFFTLGVTFTATCLSAILVEGPLANWLNCSTSSCNILDVGDQWNTYSIYLTTGIVWITFTGGEITRLGFRAVYVRFLQIFTVLGAVEFLVGYFASGLISNLIWLIPQTDPTQAYKGLFTLAVTGLLAFPLHAGNRKSAKSSNARVNLDLDRNEFQTALKKYLSADPKIMEKDGTLAFSMISYLLISTCAFLYVHFKTGIIALLSLNYVEFQSPTGTENLIAFVVLLYGIGSSINLFFILGLSANDPYSLDRQPILTSIQRTMWNAHKNFLTSFIGSDYDIKVDSKNELFLIQGISLIRSLGRITAITFAPLLNIFVAIGIALVSWMIWSIVGGSTSIIAAWGASIFFYWFIGGEFALIFFIARIVNKPERMNGFG